MAVRGIREYLSDINNNEEVRPYLHNYPFTAKNIEIRIWVYNPDGSDPSREKISYISATNGIINYYLDIPETCSYDSICKETYEEALQTICSTAKFLQPCHSGGAEHVKNALIASPDSVRQRIISLAINPYVIVPNELCFRSDNYMSRRDFVTRLDIMGKLKYGSELHILEPHSNAKFWDHEFASPTFERKIQEHITDYIKNYGGIE